jgi:hypothetical protein
MECSAAPSGRHVFQMMVSRRLKLTGMSSRVRVWPSATQDAKRPSFPPSQEDQESRTDDKYSEPIVRILVLLEPVSKPDKPL